MKHLVAFLPVFLIFLPACSDESEETALDSETPITYSFESRFQEGESVSYSGQTLRHVLISDLTDYVGSLNETLETTPGFDASVVEATLLSYYEFDSDTQGENSLRLTSEPPLLQTNYDSISKGKDLFGKVAGQDAGGEKDHKDWSTEFVGWKDESISSSGGSISSPDGLLRAFFATIGQNAQLQANLDESRAGLSTAQTALGQDLEQLTQKFLLGAITFSQAADDYLDEGLSGDNTAADEGSTYSVLEHSWDEAFGYFGASRDYLKQSDADISAGVRKDSNGDNLIDLTSEFNFGVSVNAAKRDVGSLSGTNFREQAMSAFLEGRALIAQEAPASEIAVQAKRAVNAWENSLAATCVHYINEVLTDQERLGSDEYDFSNHAKHWSELKGFALAFQFNPDSPFADGDFALFHDYLKDAPVLEGATDEEKLAFLVDLIKARDLLQKTYQLSADDVENW